MSLTQSPLYTRDMVNEFDWLAHLKTSLLSQDQLRYALSSLSRQDMVAVACLEKDVCQALVRLVDALPFRSARPVTGSSTSPVFQDFQLCYEVPVTHALWGLAESLGQLFRAALSYDSLVEAPTAFRFNDLIVQRYPAGCRGISPHRDHARYVVVVAILVLSGDGEFCVCQDRSGDVAVEIPARPGDLVLMRAPGLRGVGPRPFHLLRNVTRYRRTVGLRYDVEKGSGGLK